MVFPHQHELHCTRSVGMRCSNLASGFEMEMKLSTKTCAHMMCRESCMCLMLGYVVHRADCFARPGQILTPVQDARLLVDAFPQPPDPMLLSRLVVEELHDPSAQFAIEGVPSTVPGTLRPLLAPALDSTEFPPLPGAVRTASTFASDLELSSANADVGTSPEFAMLKCAHLCLDCLVVLLEM